MFEIFKNSKNCEIEYISLSKTFKNNGNIKSKIEAIN